MTTDSEQLAGELLPRNGQVTNPTDTRLTTVRPDSPVGRPQLDWLSDENPLPVHDPATDRGTQFAINDSTTADVDGLINAASGLKLLGFACRESASSAAVATFRIVHGTLGTHTAVIPVELIANESAREWYAPLGIAMPNGISIDWIAGTVDITVFYTSGSV